MGIIKDRTGEKYGRLTIVSYTGKQTFHGGNAIWLCKCDCGKYVERPAVMLKHSKMPSCGCYVKEHTENLNKSHGGRNERLYLVWIDMRRRCYDKKDSNYFRYGGRGIKVCDEWKDYSVFREWAIKTGYDPSARKQQCTIDRIDVDGNYCPDNCRWVDAKIQNNNRRNNKIVEFNGRKQTLKQWADEMCFNYEMVDKRLNAGWDIERAFYQPARITKKSVIHKGTC